MTNTYEAFHTQDEELRGYAAMNREIGQRGVVAALLTDPEITPEEYEEPHEFNGFGD